MTMSKQLAIGPKLMTKSDLRPLRTIVGLDIAGVQKARGILSRGPFANARPAS
jgi:hypothetical protein